MSARMIPGLTVMLLAATMASSCGPSSVPEVQAGMTVRSSPGDPDRGERVYRKYCASCHGIRGDGKGPAAPAVDPEPRDFTRGVYRYRSTPTGSLPRDEDLAWSILLGFPETPMPGFRDLMTNQDVLDVVATLKRFSPRFADEEIDDPIAIPSPVPYSSESVELGKLHYEKMQCGKCHGEKGQGDGWAKDDDMRDDLGRVIHARDFTPGTYRAGSAKEDLYRIFYTGLDGTPMPGYEDSLAPAQIYHLVNYLLFLERGRGLWYWLSTPPTWYRPSQHRVTP